MTEIEEKIEIINTSYNSYLNNYNVSKNSNEKRLYLVLMNSTFDDLVKLTKNIVIENNN